MLSEEKTKLILKPSQDIKLLYPMISSGRKLVSGSWFSSVLIPGPPL